MPAMIPAFEPLLRDLTFFLLVLLMAYYWVACSIPVDPRVARVSFLGMGASNLMLAGLLAFRWLSSGHFPLSNLYESLLFLSWGLTALHLATEIFSGSSLLGCVTAPLSLFTLSFALFSLPKGMQEETPLVPALRSNWLMMHVTAMIASYSALLLGSLAALLLLAIGRRAGERERDLPLPSSLAISPLQGGPADLPLLSHPSQARERQQAGLSKEITGELCLPRGGKVASRQAKLAGYREGGLASLPSALDSLSYRLIALGFPLLTVGILSGAVWANEAWGSYWSWDPKETWALVTWFLFAMYLHARITKGWVGERPAMIASIGFLSVWACYLGVNLVGSGLHSYGWF